TCRIGQALEGEELPLQALSHARVVVFGLVERVELALEFDRTEQLFERLARDRERSRIVSEHCEQRRDKARGVRLAHISHVNLPALTYHSKSRGKSYPQ